MVAYISVHMHWVEVFTGAPLRGGLTLMLPLRKEAYDQTCRGQEYDAHGVDAPSDLTMPRDTFGELTVEDRR